MKIKKLQEIVLDETNYDWVTRYPNPTVYFTTYQLFVNEQGQISQRIGTTRFT